MKKKFLIFCILTFIFSIIIFLINAYFFGYEEIHNHEIEEKHIETIFLDKEKKEEIIEEKQELNSAKKVAYFYFPNNFKEESLASENVYVLNSFLKSIYIYPKINYLETNLYKREGEVRGKMKNKKVHLYSLYRLPKKEVLSVFIHEFGHFLDLYILKKKLYHDLSDNFYNISWKSTKILKAGMKNKDFVSGYSMTNKYEDFAESFAYFVLHNSDFLEKTKKSEILSQKYNFFRKYLFRDLEFINSSYKTTKIVKDYYWDITKIDYDLQKFLDYLGTKNKM